MPGHQFITGDLKQLIILQIAIWDGERKDIDKNILQNNKKREQKQSKVQKQSRHSFKNSK